jgi:PAS domain-containing protein
MTTEGAHHRNEFQEGLEGTTSRTASERDVENVRERGGVFVEAVRVTRMPMVVTDATLPGNPITFVNPAFVGLSGYQSEELLGQDPHFMNGPATDPESIKDMRPPSRKGAMRRWKFCSIEKTDLPFVPCSSQLR